MEKEVRFWNLEETVTRKSASKLPEKQVTTTNKYSKIANILEEEKKSNQGEKTVTESSKCKCVRVVRIATALLFQEKCSTTGARLRVLWQVIIDCNDLQHTSYLNAHTLFEVVPTVVSSLTIRKIPSVTSACIVRSGGGLHFV